MWQFLLNSNQKFAAAITSSTSGRYLIQGFNQTCSSTSRYCRGVTLLAPTDEAMVALQTKLGKDAYTKLLDDTTTWEYYVTFHKLNSGGRDPIYTRSLTSGDKVATMATQGTLNLIVIRGRETGWGFQTPQGQTGFLTSPDNAVNNGVVHGINAFLIPPVYEPRGTTCNHTSMQGCPISRKRTRQRRNLLFGPPGKPKDPKDYTCEGITIPGVAGALVLKLQSYGGMMPPGMGTYVCVEADCGMTRVDTWDGRGYCCPEMGGWRHDKGYGTKCIAKEAGPAVLPPTPAPMPKCPMSCKDAFAHCKTKYKDNDSCLSYAAKGYLCGKEAGPCDATDLLKNEPQCPDIQVYTMCGSPCVATCESPVLPNMCMDMCVEGCFCPRSNTKGVALVWDDVNGKCSTVNDCPDVGTCDSTIETDYLDTGAHVAACKKTGSGDQCAPDTCLSGCTAANWDEAGAKYDVKCVREADAASCNKHKECQWAGDGQGTPPTFVCSTTEDAQTGEVGTQWVPQNIGTCQSSGGMAMTMCDLFQDTQCLAKKECSDMAECTKLTNTSFSNCKLPCFNAGSSAAGAQKCGTCLEEQLLSTVTINGVEGDLIACCGCLVGALEAVGISSNQALPILEGTCKKRDPAEDDDLD